MPKICFLACFYNILNILFAKVIKMILSKMQCKLIFLISDPIPITYVQGLYFTT